LGVGARQRIEIIKLLYRQASILILDEPTAVLTPAESVELFAQLRRLRDEGKTILIITHKLKEVLSLADEATVLRQGATVGRRLTHQTSADELATLMVGRKVNALTNQEPPSTRSHVRSHILSEGESNGGGPVLEFKNFSYVVGKRTVLNALDFSVNAGEIVGIAGVEGSGQSELLELISDFRVSRREGSTEFQNPGVHGRLRIEPRVGVAIIPEDRQREGLLLDRPIWESFVLGRQREAPLSRAGLLRRKAIASDYEQAVKEYGIRPAEAGTLAKGLSGGNQQKVIIAREMSQQGAEPPGLVIAAQPTRGVDVGAIEMIHARLLRARREGAAILLVSSELDELLALSDRILVMYGGKIVAEFARQRDATALAPFLAPSLAPFNEAQIGIFMAGGGAS
jgi:simple sugar transport system ATP-binding protein